jgi:hypothetical protein
LVKIKGKIKQKLKAKISKACQVQLPRWIKAFLDLMARISKAFRTSRVWN